MLYNNDTNVICLIDISLNIFDGFFKGKTFDPTFKTTIIKLYLKKKKNIEIQSYDHVYDDHAHVRCF